MKPNWACAVCGMFSSRRYNVQRYIRTLHNGYAYVVAFIDYMIGRQMGYYIPASVPKYTGKNSILQKYSRKSIGERGLECV